MPPKLAAPKAKAKATPQELSKYRALRRVTKSVNEWWHHLQNLATDPAWPNGAAHTALVENVRKFRDELRESLTDFPGLLPLLRWHVRQATLVEREVRKPTVNFERDKVARLCAPAIARMNEMRRERLALRPV